VGQPVVQYIADRFDRYRYSCQNAVLVAHHTYFSSIMGINGVVIELDINIAVQLQ
jgi:hypothetical protein